MVGFMSHFWVISWLIFLKQLEIWNFPTKICIKFAPYLHRKSGNWALNMVLSYALVLMLLTKLVSKSKFVQIRYHIMVLALKCQMFSLVISNHGKKLIISNLKSFLKHSMIYLNCITYLL